MLLEKKKKRKKLLDTTTTLDNTFHPVLPPAYNPISPPSKQTRRSRWRDENWGTIDFKTEDDRPGRFCGQGLNSASGCRDRRRSIIAPVAGKSKK